MQGDFKSRVPQVRTYTLELAYIILTGYWGENDSWGRWEAEGPDNCPSWHF